MTERARCIVLVPHRESIDAACEASLRGLEGLGYPVRRSDASAAIDRTRSEMATRALAEGYEELLWIDSDIAFAPEAVDRLRSHGLPLVGGLFARRGVAHFGCRFFPETKEFTLGEGGGPLEVRYQGTAFLLTHRRVYEDIARVCDLPLCNTMADATPAVPYFLPMVLRDPEVGPWYLSEAWSFCERARQAGHKVMIETSIRLWHYGRYGYAWEDVGAPRQRVPSAKIRIAP
jgi:hypothetical protein